ncbi:MAG: hypothetical protein ACI9VR_000610 [Cognaticolwellia sp.]|jgi:hypothetical protein
MLTNDDHTVCDSDELHGALWVADDPMYGGIQALAKAQHHIAFVPVVVLTKYDDALGFGHSTAEFFEQRLGRDDLASGGGQCHGVSGGYPALRKGRECGAGEIHLGSPDPVAELNAAQEREHESHPRPKAHPVQGDAGEHYPTAEHGQAVESLLFKDEGEEDQAAEDEHQGHAQGPDVSETPAQPHKQGQTKPDSRLTIQHRQAVPSPGGPLGPSALLSQSAGAVDLADVGLARDFDQVEFDEVQVPGTDGEQHQGDDPAGDGQTTTASLGGPESHTQLD